MTPPRFAADPFRALTSAFFARFFESEITTGYDDLKGSFFWLLAALGVGGRAHNGGVGFVVVNFGKVKGG